MAFFKSVEAKTAFRLGSICSISYLVVYISRNILSAVSPDLIKYEIFNEAQLGVLSMVFFFCYAIGQLINGIIGEKIKAGYMISFGQIIAGLCNIAFVVFLNPILNIITYGLWGFSLSMIYAPMTKVVSENTSTKLASLCCMTFTFSALFGSPLAGIIALIFNWKYSFFASGGLLVGMGLITLLVFTVMEKKGIVKYNQFKSATKEKGSLSVLFENRIVRFSIIALLTGVVRTSVVFWIPTYTSTYLGYSEDTSKILFTIITLAISFAPFLAAYINSKFFKNNVYNTLLLSFITSAVAFLGMYFIKNPVVNLIIMFLAIFTSKLADAMLWSFYCPSLKHTGMVSTATGTLDFFSYFGAAISTYVFGDIALKIGWGNLILIWFAIMFIGIFFSFTPKKKTV